MLQVHGHGAALHQPGFVQLPRVRGAQHARGGGGGRAAVRAGAVLAARRARHHAATPRPRGHHRQVSRSRGTATVCYCLLTC